MPTEYDYDRECDKIDREMENKEEELKRKIERLIEQGREDEKRLERGEAVPLKGGFELMRLQSELKGFQEAKAQILEIINSIKDWRGYPPDIIKKKLEELKNGINIS